MSTHRNKRRVWLQPRIPDSTHPRVTETSIQDCAARLAIARSQLASRTTTRASPKRIHTVTIRSVALHYTAGEAPLGPLSRSCQRPGRPPTSDLFAGVGPSLHEGPPALPPKHPNPSRFSRRPPAALWAPTRPHGPQTKKLITMQFVTRLLFLSAFSCHAA